MVLMKTWLVHCYRAIEEARATAKEAGRDLYFVATVCGTTKDPQNYQSSVDRLKEGGVLVAESNAKAVQLALLLKRNRNFRRR